MRLIVRLAIILVVIAVTSVPAIVTARYRLRHDADLIVRSSYELFQQEQRPSLDDLRRRFGDKLSQTSPCIESGCGFEVVVSNRLLAGIHLVRFATLKSTFWVRKGTVDENAVEFWTIQKDGQMILAYTDAKYCNACNDFSSHNSISIDLSSQGSQKRAAFGFNTDCLLSMKGCATAAELLPAVQHD